jgi:hypothetical protein
MLLAESLTAGQGYEIHGTPHGKYPPGFPVYLSLMYRMGLGDMLTLNIFMCGMSFLALYCSYKLLRLLAHPLSALVATLVCGFLFELYRVTGAQLSDVPFPVIDQQRAMAAAQGLARTQRLDGSGRRHPGGQLLGAGVGDTFVPRNRMRNIAVSSAV